MSDETRAVVRPLTRYILAETKQLLQRTWGSNALVQEMREDLARRRSEHVAAPDVLTITNPEMLEHRGIRAGDIILTPDGTKAVAQQDYMLVEAGVEPGEAPAADPSRGARTPCVRCTLPEATTTDLEAWNHLQGGQPLPPGWPDDQGSHLCWRGVANGDCCPEGPKVRVTAGRLVLHDGDFALLSAPVEDVITALREAVLLPSEMEGSQPYNPWKSRAFGALSDLQAECAKTERLESELAQARADLAAAQDLLMWPRWAHVREGGVLELRSPTFVLLAVVWGAHNDIPAGWRAWHGPVGSGPPCPWEQGAGGIDEAEAYLVQHGRIRPGCTIRPPPE